MKKIVLMSALLLMTLGFTQAQDAGPKKARKDLVLNIHREKRSLHHDRRDHHGDVREYFKHHRMERHMPREHKGGMKKEGKREMRRELRGRNH